MSVKAQAWALEQVLDAPRKLVLLVLAWHASDDGMCWPGISLLARECGMTTRNLRRHLRYLELGRGLIAIEDRTDAYGRDTSNLYVLQMSTTPVHVNGVDPDVHVTLPLTCTSGTPDAGDRVEADAGDRVTLTHTSAKPSVEPSSEPSVQPSVEGNGAHTRARPRGGDKKDDARLEEIRQLVSQISNGQVPFIDSGTPDRRELDACTESTRLISEAYVNLHLGAWDDDHIAKRGSLAAVIQNLAAYVDQREEIVAVGRDAWTTQG